MKLHFYLFFFIFLKNIFKLIYNINNKTIYNLIKYNLNKYYNLINNYLNLSSILYNLIQSFKFKKIKYNLNQNNCSQ